MSIMYCNQHGKWDSDNLEECPNCIEEDTLEHSVEANKKALRLWNKAVTKCINRIDKTFKKHNIKI